MLKFFLTDTLLNTFSFTLGILMLFSICFIFGDLFGTSNIDWVAHAATNKASHIAQVILKLPVVYLIMSLGMRIK